MVGGSCCSVMEQESGWICWCLSHGLRALLLGWGLHGESQRLLELELRGQGWGWGESKELGGTDAFNCLCSAVTWQAGRVILFKDAVLTISIVACVVPVRVSSQPGALGMAISWHLAHTHSPGRARQQQSQPLWEGVVPMPRAGKARSLPQAP